MSLGPPFDASGLQRQRVVGAFALLALGGAVAWVLVGAGRTVGPGIVVHVQMTTTGPLRAGAAVRLAGRRIGEVRRAGMLGAADQHAVVLDAFIERAWVFAVHKNSEFFIETPSVLGEAYLEIGPPRNGATPGEVVSDGDLVRGVDPPEIDRFLQYAEANVRVVLALMRETRPEANELLAAGDSLLAHLSQLPTDRGQLRRIRDQAEAALDRGRELLAVLRDAHAVERVRHLTAELGAIADQAGPELAALGIRIERAANRLEELRALFGPERKAQLNGALAHLRAAARLGERTIADVRAIQARIARGDGAVGAFLQDRELFDDLHETHRILKSQPLRFILKTQDQDKK